MEYISKIRCITNLVIGSFLTKQLADQSRKFGGTHTFPFPLSHQNAALPAFKMSEC